jgi:hypothetical protein
MPPAAPPHPRGGRAPRPVRRGRRRGRSGPRKRLVLFLPADLVKALRGQAAARAEPLEATLEVLLRRSLRGAGEARP